VYEDMTTASRHCGSTARLEGAAKRVTFIAWPITRTPSWKVALIAGPMDGRTSRCRRRPPRRYSPAVPKIPTGRGP